MGISVYQLQMTMFNIYVELKKRFLQSDFSDGLMVAKRHLCFLSWGQKNSGAIFKPFFKHQSLTPASEGNALNHDLLGSQGRNVDSKPTWMCSLL